MLVPIGIASKHMGVCTKTLRRWERKGLLKPQRTAGGHRRYDRTALDRFVLTGKYETSTPETENVAVYARVSSQRQKGDLERQVEFLKDTASETTGKNVIEYSDIGSGLNDGRKGLMRMLTDAASGRFETVYVTYSDRLARFGTNVIVKALDTYGVGVKVLRTADKKDLQSQVVDDIVAPMHSFSGKLYRLRRGKYGKGDT